MKSYARSARREQPKNTAAPFHAPVTSDNSVMLERMRDAQAEERRQPVSMGGLGGGGPVPGSFGWGFLSGDQPELNTPAQDRRGHGLGKDIHIEENVIDGHWADTLQGERVNEGAGSGFHDSDHLGDQSDWVMEECKEQAKTVMRVGGGLSLAAGAFFGVSGIALGVAGSLAAGGLWYLGCEANNAIVAMDDSSKKKRPREDQEGGGDSVPVMLGPNRPQVGTTGRGRAGGSGDGRGADSGATSQGPVVMSDLSIAQHNGVQVGAPEREPEGSVVSFEEMLSGSFHTDPDRA